MTTKIMQRLAGKVSVLIMVALLTAAMGTYGLLKWKHGSTTHASATAPASLAKAAEIKQAKLPLVFEPNLGQTDSRVKFVARSSGYVTFLTGPSQAVLKIQTDTSGQTDVVTMNLAGANAKAQGGAIEKTRGVSNYYIGNDRSKWLEGVPNYAKVRYNGVYPGVDVVYQGDASRFRYDFVVKPGADPRAIRLQFDGARDVHTDAGGNLAVTVGKSGHYASSRPVAYQEFGGRRHAVASSYVLNGNEARFHLGSYDRTKELIIDPNFTTATYFGAPGGDLGYTYISAIAGATNPTINGSGSVLVTGQTISLNFPTKNPYQASYGGTGNDGDAIVASFPYNMQAPNYSTYLGGSDVDAGTAIAVDNSSTASTYPEAVVTGYTQSSTSFPVLNPIAESGTPTPAQHIFLAKFTSSGTLLNSSVLFGGGSEKGLGVSVDVNGGVHLTGSTTSINLVSNLNPATLGFQHNNNSTASTNAFYFKFSPSGSTLTTAIGTYLGGFGTDSGNAIAVDPSSNAATVLIVGTSNSFGQTSTGAFNFPNFPLDPSTGVNLNITGSTSHGFATQICTGVTAATCATAGALVKSWYIGTNGHSEAGTAAAFDLSGDLYAGGNASGENKFAAPVAAGLTLLGTASTGAGAQDGWAFEIPSAANGGIAASTGTLVNGDETAGNGGVAAAVADVTALAVDTLNQIYITGGTTNTTGATAGQGAIIRRRAFAGFFEPAGTTPFLGDYQNQETNSAGFAEVLPLGDMTLGVAGVTAGAAPTASVANGQANGVSFDGSGNNACFGGFVSQEILDAATPTVNSLIPPTAFQNNSAGSSAVNNATPVEVGVVGCATYNSDTIIQVNGTTTNNPTFTFSLPVGTTSTTPGSQSFNLVNFDPAFPNPTYTIIANTGGASVPAGTIPFLAGNYSPNTTTSGGLWLQWASGSGDTIKLSVVTANAETFEPGIYTAFFYVVPHQGDNAGVPQKVTVTLTVTGQLIQNTTFAGGVPMSNGGQCVVGTETCTFTVSNGATFSDGNSVEEIQVPFLSVVPANAPTSGAVTFNGGITTTDPTLGTFTGVSWTTLGPAGGFFCGGPPGIAPPDHLTSNSPVVCYLTFTIPASNFAGALNGTYTNKFTTNVTGLSNPDQVAPESSAASAPALPGAITFIVIVNNNQLLFTGNNQFSSPVGPVGNTTITTTDILDSKYLNTTTATAYTAAEVPAVGAACPGGTATAGIPGFAFGNNGTLPASNATAPNPPYSPTQIPYPVSVPNPGSDAPGTYATTVTVSACAPNTGPGYAAPCTVTQTAPKTYCLTVGNTITVTFNTNDLPTDQPPLYLEAGTQQTATMDITALGTLVPQAAPPGPVVVPFTITAGAANPNWEVLQGACLGVTLTTPQICNIQGNGSANINPPLTTPAMEYDPAWTVTATGTAGDASNGADQALVNPPLPTQTPGTTETFIFRTQLTSGLDLFYWTDFSLYADSANGPPGNYVTGATLAAETNPPPPYDIDPIYSLAYPPGGTNIDWPGTGKPIVLQFYEVQNSGVYEMQDGTPAGVGPLHLLCTILDVACQDVYITASGAEPRLTLPVFYTFTSVDFLLGPGPTPTCHGGAGFGPPAECTLESDINGPIANVLTPGQYTAFYTIDTTDGLSANIPQPSPTTVEIILTVIPNPSVTLLPNPLTFSYNVGAPATAPPSITLSMGTSAPSGPVAVTLTPTAGTATVALSVNGGTPSTSPITVCVVGGAIQDCKGNNETVTASIINLATLTTTGSYGATILASVPQPNPVTGLPNAPVSNTSFSVPVNVVVSSTPSIGISPNLTFNFTVGQTGTSPANGTMTITLAGNDTYNVTSSKDWVALGPPVPNNTATLSTVAVTINIAAADLPAAGTTGTSTITVKGLSGESATATVSLIVTATPTITLTPPTGVSNPDNATYYFGSPDPPTIPVGVSLTPTPPLPTYPTYAMTATVNAAATSWCAATQPGNVNASGGSFTVTLTPNEAGLAVSATPYTCTITVAGNGGIASTTFVINLTVSGPTLTSVTPTPVVFNIPLLPTGSASSKETMTGTGTYSFKTTPATLTPQPPNSVAWLSATSPAQLTNGAGTMTVSVVTAAADTLGVGQFVGSVAFQGPSPTPFNLPVTLNVAQITATPSTLTAFTYYINYTTPTPQSVALAAPITGGGDAGLGFTATPSASWITVSQTAGTTGVTPATLAIGYNPATLPASATPYTGNVSIAMAGSSAPPLVISVSLTVFAEPTLSASAGGSLIAGPPTNAGNTTLIGFVGGTPVSETLTVTGNGLPTGGTMPFTASVASTGGWLQLQSGATLASSVTGITGGTIVLVGNPAGLSAGTYDGALTISGPSASNSLNILVVLSIPGPAPCGFTFSSGGTVNLPSAGTSTTSTIPGGALPQNPVTVTLTPIAGASCSSTYTASSNASWLTVTTSGSTITYTALSNATTNPVSGVITVSNSNGGSEALTVNEAADTETQVQREVRALYESVLGRDPDPGGFTFWTGVGTGGLGQMTDGFFTSQESFNSNFAVIAAYQGATGGPPTFAEFSTAVASVRAGGSPVTWFSNLAASNGLSVAGLYQNLLNRQPKAAESVSCTTVGLAQCWQNLIGYPANNNPVSATNNEFQSTGTFQNLVSPANDHTNAQYIYMLYFTILDRDPDAGGLQFWLNVANSGGSGILFQGAATYATRIQILGPGVPNEGFTGSPEFIAKFQ